jgi:adenosylcobinamide kinase/adenosylcobinamide-phosphate guanylyltransferase
MKGIRSEKKIGSILMQNNKQKTLILGGAASGKSQYAENLVKVSKQKKFYLASANIYDKEMQSKVKKHKLRRGDDWTTITEPLNAADKIAKLNDKQIMLFDCATMWLTNHFLEENDIHHEIELLINSIKFSSGSIVIVTNEVGAGIVPENSMARKFRELQGELNQRLAASANHVVQVIAGLPLTLKKSQ